MRVLSRRFILGLPFIGPLFAKAALAQAGSGQPDTEWRYYAGDLSNNRYSPLDQINAGNFNNLEVAWRFKTESLGPRTEYQFESTPLVIKGRLYSVAGSRRDIVCLDAANGEQLWMHSENEGERGATAPRQLSGRGLSYWTDGREERIIYVTPGYRMIALDAQTGIPVKSFGDNGVVDLKLNDDQTMDLVHSDIGLHSTPLVYKNIIVVGAAHLNGDIPHNLGRISALCPGARRHLPGSGSGFSTPSRAKANSAMTPGSSRARRRRPAIPAPGRRCRRIRSRDIIAIYPGQEASHRRL